MLKIVLPVVVNIKLLHFLLIIPLLLFSNIEVKKPINNKTKIKMEVAIFANGCYWCTEAIFQNIKGVKKVVSGYIGGKVQNPTYKEVCTGKTGHAEALRIEFDSEKVTYYKLLEIFFKTHDPTTLNRQGNDIGTQYRSEIFYLSDEQKKQAEEYIELLKDKKIFKNRIVTTVTKASKFYPAEDYHQNYYKNNINQPYCKMVIFPKLEKFTKEFRSILKY